MIVAFLFIAVSVAINCQRRLAFVVPFTQTEIHKLASQIDNEWAIYTPFFDDRDLVVRRCVDLVLFFHTMIESTTVQLLTDVLTKVERKQRLFAPKNIHFHSARLSQKTDATRVSGANAMFLNLLCTDTLHSRYRHIFLMEVDVHPLRSGWAPAAYRLAAAGDSNDVWMRGSLYYGHGPPVSMWHTMHMNGNAFYTMTADFAEQCACSTAVRDATNAGDPYDVAIYFKCYQFEDLHLARRNAHHFQYTNYILNYYYGESNATAILLKHPTAFLIHSKSLRNQE